MALFERFGGPEVGALACRRFLEGHTDEATPEAWLRLAFPLYTRVPRDPAVVQRAVRHPEVTHWFTQPAWSTLAGARILAYGGNAVECSLHRGEGECWHRDRPLTRAILRRHGRAGK